MPGKMEHKGPHTVAKDMSYLKQVKGYGGHTLADDQKAKGGMKHNSGHGMHNSSHKGGKSY